MLPVLLLVSSYLRRGFSQVSCLSSVPCVLLCPTWDRSWLRGALPDSGAVWFCLTHLCTHIKHDHSEQPGCCCCSTGGSAGSWGVGTQLRGSWSSVLCKLLAAPVPQGREVWLGLSWVFSLPRDCSGSHLLLLGRCFPQPAWRKEVASNSQLSVSKAVLFCSVFLGLLQCFDSKLVCCIVG